MPRKEQLPSDQDERKQVLDSGESSAVSARANLSIQVRSQGRQRTTTDRRVEQPAPGRSDAPRSVPPVAPVITNTYEAPTFTAHAQNNPIFPRDIPRESYDIASSNPAGRTTTRYYSTSRTNSDRSRPEPRDTYGGDQGGLVTARTANSTRRRDPPPSDDGRGRHGSQGTGVRSSALERPLDDIPPPTQVDTVLGPQTHHPREEAVTSRPRLTQSNSRPGYNPYDEAQDTQANPAGLTRTLGAVPRPSNTTASAPTAATARNVPDAPPFQPGLALDLRYLANIPRGDFGGVFTHLRENFSLVDQNPGLLFEEAVRALDYHSRYGITQHGDKSKYAESCIQQYVLLRTLLLSGRQSRQGVVSDGLLNSFFQDLHDRKPDVLKQFYKDFDAFLKQAKSESHTGRQPAENEPTSGPQQQATTSASGRLQQSPVLRRTDLETTRSALSNLNIHPAPGRQDTDPMQRAPTSRVQTRDQSGSEQPRRPAAGERRNSRQHDALVSTRPTSGQTHDARADQLTTSATSRAQQGTSPPSSHPAPLEQAVRLDPRYVVRRPEYYQVGRVFAMLLHENYTGDAPTDNASDNITIGRYGERIHSAIRRMVVVRRDHGFAVCVAVSTYGGRGLFKFKNTRDVEAHAIIHMHDAESEWLPGEPRSSKHAIAVRRASPDQYLTPASRVCFSQPHTVRYTVKSLDVGFVTKDSLAYLLNYYKKADSPDD